MRSNDACRDVFANKTVPTISTPSFEWRFHARLRNIFRDKLSEPQFSSTLHKINVQATYDFQSIMANTCARTIRKPLKVIQASTPSPKHSKKPQLRLLRLSSPPTNKCQAPPPPPVTSPKRSRTVRFSGTTQVVLVRKRSLEEKSQSWYSGSDYQQFDQDRRETLRKFHNQCMDQEEMTLAGLEGHLERHTAVARKRLTRYHCYSVLRQQYYNHWYGIHDDESLRNVSLYYSRQTGMQQAALQRSLLKLV